VDGQLVKVLQQAGTGWERPAKGAEVTVHYTGTLAQGGLCPRGFGASPPSGWAKAPPPESCTPFAALRDIAGGSYRQHLGV